ncbi:MAG: hypothetical protein ACKV1O_20325 [Saprospiraceae bacterium]
MNSQNLINNIIDNLLSPKVKERSERLILTIAIVSYIVHLLLIILVNQELIQIESKLFKNPIAAIYTPFSFILLYEVYLLVFFLPKSITTYIGKQYEIITLIVIRRIFKDISHLELHTNWFQNRNDLQFTYDVATSLVLFVLIYLFYQKNNKKDFSKNKKSDKEIKKINRFIILKKAISITLLPILAALAFYTLYNWVSETIQDYRNGILAFENINNIFFEEFFTILIIIDVLLLLLSFFYSDEFHKIIRNSGFVISTILIKMSFSVEGIVNNALIIGAVLFGYVILTIHNMYEKKGVPGTVHNEQSE